MAKCKSCSKFFHFKQFETVHNLCFECSDKFYSSIIPTHIVSVKINLGNIDAKCKKCKYCGGDNDTFFCNYCSITKLFEAENNYRYQNSSRGENTKYFGSYSCRDCVGVAHCRNCISCETCRSCDDCLDCFECKSCSYSFNCDSCKKLHQCGNCDFCENCVFCNYCLKSNNCSDSQYLTNCSYCEFCSDCEDLNGTPGNPFRYYIDNVQYSKEKYFKMLEKTNKNEMGAGKTRDWLQEIKDVGAVFVDAFNRLLLY